MWLFDGCCWKRCCVKLSKTANKISNTAQQVYEKESGGSWKGKDKDVRRQTDAFSDQDIYLPRTTTGWLLLDFHVFCGYEYFRMGYGAE